MSDFNDDMSKAWEREQEEHIERLITHVQAAFKTFSGEDIARSKALDFIDAAESNGLVITLA